MSEAYGDALLHQWAEWCKRDSMHRSLVSGVYAKEAYGNIDREARATLPVDDEACVKVDGIVSRLEQRLRQVVVEYYCYTAQRPEQRAERCGVSERTFYRMLIQAKIVVYREYVA